MEGSSGSVGDSFRLAGLRGNVAERPVLQTMPIEVRPVTLPTFDRRRRLHNKAGNAVHGDGGATEEGTLHRRAAESST
jgi:hypothetical protein